MAFLAPASSLDPAKEAYALKTLKAPALSGTALKAFLMVYETSAGGAIYNAMAGPSGVQQVLQDIRLPEQPLFLPLAPAKDLPLEQGCEPLRGSTPQEILTHLATLISPAASAPAETPSATADGTSSQPAAYRRPTVADYHAAYTSKAVTPSQVADRLLAALAKVRAQHLGWFVATRDEDIRAQAAASTARWAAGQPLSLLDGVPFAVKDVIHAEGYATTLGTSFVPQRWPAPTGDAPLIAVLKGLGAILLGKTSLHEIGLGVTGLNLRTGTALNPHQTGHFCGGSSSGSGAVVAAGLCPIAIGTDGGGSIRIPASFCGVVGLKPTNGRVTGEGCFKVDCTVAAMGPLAGSVQDATILYAVCANLAVHATLNNEPPPAPAVPKALQPADPSPLQGARAGVYWEWFNDSAPEVVGACKAALQLLQGAGLSVSDVHIPELEHLRVAHNITIVSEMMHCFKAEWEDKRVRGQFNPDVRLGLDSSRFWSPADYLQAQRIRRRATTHFQRAMQDVDVLITPTVPCTAPAIPRGALTGGHSDLSLTSRIMRFALQANMLGLPAISVPVGVDSAGLPIGLQIIGKSWQEGTLLRYAAVLEAAMIATHRTPPDGTATSSSAPATPRPPGPTPPALWIDPLTGAGAGLV